jgi:hypothetical protein
MENYDKPHTVEVPFPNAHAAFSFMAELDELGYRGIVRNEDGQTESWEAYEESPA